MMNETEAFSLAMWMQSFKYNVQRENGYWSKYNHYDYCLHIAHKYWR